MEGGRSPDSKMAFSHIFISNSKIYKNKGGSVPRHWYDSRAIFDFNPEYNIGQIIGSGTLCKVIIIVRPLE